MLRAWLSVNIFLPQGHEEALCHWLVHGAWPEHLTDLMGQNLKGFNRDCVA